MAVSVSQDPAGSRGRVLAVISVATILALSIWFSTNAIGPALEREKGFSTSDLSWLTIAVQLGFVALLKKFQMPQLIYLTMIFNLVS